MRFTASAALQRITDAELFVKLLQNYEYIRVITTIRQQLQETVQELEQIRNLLKLKLAEIRVQFTGRKAKLYRQESATLEAAVTEDRERTIFITTNLSQSLNIPVIKIPASIHNDLSLSEHPRTSSPAKVQASWENMEAIASLKDNPCRFTCVSKLISQSKSEDNNFKAVRQNSEPKAPPTPLSTTTSNTEDTWVRLTTAFNKEEVKDNSNKGQLFHNRPSAFLAPSHKLGTGKANLRHDS